MTPSLRQRCQIDKPDCCATFNFTSGDSETRAALRDICDHIATFGINADCTNTAELVLAEVLNNITEHAYAGQMGKISVALHYARDHLTLRITDRGRAMPGNSVPTPPPPDPLPPDNLPEGGFGWYLIHLLTTNLSYQRTGEQNVLTYQISCAPAADSTMPSHGHDS